MLVICLLNVPLGLQLPVFLGAANLPLGLGPLGNGTQRSEPVRASLDSLLQLLVNDLTLPVRGGAAGTIQLIDWCEDVTRLIQRGNKLPLLLRV